MLFGLLVGQMRTNTRTAAIRIQDVQISVTPNVFEVAHSQRSRLAKDRIVGGTQTKTNVSVCLVAKTRVASFNEVPADTRVQDARFSDRHNSHVSVIMHYCAEQN